MKVKRKLQGVLLDEALRYLEHSPEVTIPKLLRLLEPWAQLPRHRHILQAVVTAWEDENSNWRRLIVRAFEQLAPSVRRRFLTNFLLNASLEGIPRGHALAAEHKINVPWAILMDPTSRCNLSCRGCWAQEYDKTADLSLATMDRIIREGKELGIYMYLYSGGEPLLRAADIVTLAERHDDCIFCAFTNGRLVDSQLALTLAELGNVALALSVEGFAADTDGRRGAGSYQHMMNAMDHLRHHGALFGFSTCYHRDNTAGVVDPAFVDSTIARGAFFGWYFTYIPLGQHAEPQMLATAEQRLAVMQSIRRFRREKDLFFLDFWNDGESSGGCIAGGRRYLHINAHGDVEPCAFVHYSDTNIHNASLWEALHSPLFLQYRQNQPFNENLLLPCPLLDNPARLGQMVAASGARSTQHRDRESPEVLAAKCLPAARLWQTKAAEIWNEHLTAQ